MRSLPVNLRAAVAGIALAFAFPAMSLAQLEGVATEDLVRRADVVVVGRVTGVRSEWNSDRSRILSNVTVSVEQRIKGDEPGTTVVISTPGGEVGGVGEFYSHMPRFKADEHVVVFAARDQRGQLRVVGGDEGKVKVLRNEATGVEMVSEREPLGVYAARLMSIVQAQKNEK